MEATQIMSDQSLTLFEPAMPPEAIRKGIKAYKDAITAVLTKDDVIKMGDNTFIRKGGCNKLNLFFGVNTDTVRSWRTQHEDGSFTWTVVVKAWKCNYEVTRSASCHSAEKSYMIGKDNEKRMEADVYAMAETRAVGRATTAFFGTSDVVYEEIEGSKPEDINRKPNQKPAEVSEYCACPMEETNPSETVIEGTQRHQCKKCAKQIGEGKYNVWVSKQKPA